MAAEKPSKVDERRAEFARYKQDVKKRGKPFYPYAMFHDTVMSLVVVAVIITLAVPVEVDVLGAAPRRHAPGPARAGVHRPRRPGHGQLRPAAGLVLLLPLLPAPDLQVAGVGRSSAPSAFRPSA